VNSKVFEPKMVLFIHQYSVDLCFWVFLQPWVLFGFNMIIAGGGVMELIGILIGHLYFFLMFKYPQDFGGPSLLSTPEFLYNWFPNRRGGVRGLGAAPVQAQAPGGGGGGAGGGGGGRFGGYTWGRGQRLAD